MNERIKELIKQATYIQGPTPYNPLRFEVFDKEKFAELIIRECMNEIHVADVGDLKGKGYYLDKVAEHIEKHFGVSE